MLSDKHIRTIVDFPKLYEAFPGVKIRGGVSYFVWDQAHNGPCEVETIWDGKPTGPRVARNLDAYDVLIRRNEAVPILDKVQEKREETLISRVSSRKPFGLPSNFRGHSTPEGLVEPVKLYETLQVAWVERSAIATNQDWIDSWKVLMTKAQGTSAAVETKFLTKPIIAPPGSACTETYLVAGRFNNETEAKNYAAYLRTRFVRFLVSLRKATQNAARDVYAFVPDLPLNEEWTDEKLYARYRLSSSEILFIESQVSEQTDDPSPITLDDDE
jgi:site-specific DNA-methyltransferase (adenine-specific)